MRKIRLWIADDHMVVRSGLRQIAAATKDLRVIGESPDGPGALQAARRGGFDVLLLDLSMPGGGIDLVARLRQVSESLRILVLTMHGEPQMAVRALKAGAAGYVTKDADANLLLEALRAVAAGKEFVEPGVEDGLLFERVDESEPSPAVLTQREREILDRLAAGISLAQIACNLGCSTKTVSVHKTRLMRKLKIASNAELFHYAMRHGIGE